MHKELFGLLRSSFMQVDQSDVRLDKTFLIFIEPPSRHLQYATFQYLWNYMSSKIRFSWLLIALNTDSRDKYQMLNIPRSIFLILHSSPLNQTVYHYSRLFTVCPLKQAVTNQEITRCTIVEAVLLILIQLYPCFDPRWKDFIFFAKILFNNRKPLRASEAMPSWIIRKIRIKRRSKAA